MAQAQAQTHVGHRIRSRREEMGLRQAQLARLLGLEQTQLSRYERTGRVPRDDRMKAIARILKCKVSWLRNED
jgi:transcriptional regulator with XRE-family HTH domain